MAQPFTNSDWKQPVFASLSPLDKYRRFREYQVVLFFAAVRTDFDLLGLFNYIIFDVFESDYCICSLCITDRFVAGKLFDIKLDPIARSAGYQEQLMNIIDKGDVEHRL